jgi:SAM-dependent methyltransferase
VIEHLPRVIPEHPERPDGAGADHPMRIVTRQVAFEPDGWTPARASKVAGLFDDLAPEWHTRDHPNRLDPLTDAFERGGPIANGRCVEVGSGTGLATPWLADRFATLVCIDLSHNMLRLAPEDVGHRVLADCAALPVRTRSIDAVVLMNALLFAAETDRVLNEAGVVIWVNSSGDRTPIHLPPEDVAAALPGDWDGVASEAGWGTWSVLRRRS